MKSLKRPFGSVLRAINEFAPPATTASRNCLSDLMGSTVTKAGRANINPPIDPDRTSAVGKSRHRWQVPELDRAGFQYDIAEMRGDNFIPSAPPRRRISALPWPAADISRETLLNLIVPVDGVLRRENPMMLVWVDD
jgi:hypothetical protein